MIKTIVFILLISASCLTANGQDDVVVQNYDCSNSGLPELKKKHLRGDGWGRVKRRGLYMLLNKPIVRCCSKKGESERVFLEVKYNGKTRKKKPLKSGIIERQVCLKLKSPNTCNVLYICWNGVDIGEEFINIQTKRNASILKRKCRGLGKCDGEGYDQPIATIQLQNKTLLDQKFHTLSAQIVKSEKRLIVCVDNAIVYRGLFDLPIELNGTSGIRSQNGKFLCRFYSN